MHPPVPSSLLKARLLKIGMGLGLGLLALISTGGLLAALVAPYILTVFTFQSSGLPEYLWYTEGTCTILSKTLIASTSSSGEESSTTTFYAPHFVFSVQTSERKTYLVSGYNSSGLSSDNRLEQQAILNQYKVGMQYQCWYNTSTPTQAVLVRGININNLLLELLLLLFDSIIPIALFRSYFIFIRPRLLPRFKDIWQSRYRMMLSYRNLLHFKHTKRFPDD